MNKSRYVFFILACLFGLYVQAQNRTVKGRVLSAEDKEPLIGATVKIPGCIGRTEVAGYDSGCVHFGKFRSAGC